MDWMYPVLILGFGAFCFQIFAVFRKQAALLQPTVEQLEASRANVEKQIQESEQVTEESLKRIESLKNELANLDDQRKQLQEQLNPKEMILIDSGDFLMGDEDGSRDEQPQRTVLLNAYWIDRYPVTNQEYKMFVDVTGHRRPPHWTSGTYPLEQASHPVTNISWQDAEEYAEWVGKRLPSESEWEKAARGTLGQTYSWGDAFRKDNVNSTNDYGGTTPIDQFPGGASPYGVMDMCGNVQEWGSDWYYDDYYKTAPVDNPTGPAGGQYRVCRGGFYAENRMGVRCSQRHYAPPSTMQDHIGFRCARTPEGIAR
ncbi:MAG: SUMF1/EgtB/PvdO family nonheme iron enzyme [Candidatus Latescibacteria bacterium]|jgi:formylglycine-generating enzyme|nr:SUMF1/EgtB/PvdO family nonheme iron enzyme [Candidatus Latescibacterota bacterium]MBT5830553.1 SUMF1/EgtB/PvdO family nonheme iron enzyme [Candidatus Latescibacterota bacterium]